MPGPMTRPPPRLGSLNSRPPAKRPRPPAPASKGANGEKRCINPNCGSTNLDEEDGTIICKDCFTEVADANIVAEVQFNEESGGRATVQGASVSENSRHAKTLGAETFKRLGGGGRNSIMETERTGKRALAAICPKLGISEIIVVQAEQLWNLAANINFSAGRRTDEVAGACLYAACRRQQDNDVLLMDIAELIKVNVFRLGEVYRDLLKNLYMAEENPGRQHMVELEPLIFKYCQKLQFGDKTNVVAEDALKIIKRMNRDWIVSGRHPAGLCGACIILAARMNNFQRSVREVVYVSKVADVTIAKRVEEFRRTKSAGLTVEDFRKYANRMKYQHDPPAMTATQERLDKVVREKRKRDDHYRQSTARDSQNRESVIDIPDDATNASSRASSFAPGTPAPDDETDRPQKRQRMDESASQAASTATQQQPQSTPSASDASPQFIPVNPPQQTQESNKRKRDDRTSGADDAEASAKRVRTEEPQAPGTQASVPPPQAPRYDADGFAIPALPQVPIDPAITGAAQNPVQAQKPAEAQKPTEAQKPAKRGRKPKADGPPEVIISQEELAEEDYLEKQIESYLVNDDVQESQTEIEKAKEEERIAEEFKRAKTVAQEQQKLDAEKNKARRDANWDGDWFGPAPTGETVTAEELEKEFENDPEIERCVLQPFEVEIKERIWVAHNEDWLRKQAEKELLAKTAPKEGKRKSKKGDKPRKKRSKMGDGSVLTESSTPIETPADAARAMLEKRAPQRSAFVDFSALQKIYGRKTPSRDSSSAPDASGSGNDSGSQSRDQTPATDRQPSATPAPSEPESQADGGAAESPGDDEQEVASPEADEEVDDEEDEPESMDNPSRRVQAATWDDIGEDNHGDEDDGEDDYRRAIGQGEEQDEFGVIGGDYDSEGEEYE